MIVADLKGAELFYYVYDALLFIVRQTPLVNISSLQYISLRLAAARGTRVAFNSYTMKTGVLPCLQITGKLTLRVFL